MADGDGHAVVNGEREPAGLDFLLLADTLRRHGQADAARHVLRRGLARHPEVVEAHDLLARLSVTRGDLAGAEQAWHAVRRLEPSHPGAARGLAFVALRLREREAAAGSRGATRGPHEREAAAAAWFEPLLASGQRALLLDRRGDVVAGGSAAGPADGRRDAVGRELATVRATADRTTRELGIGRWRSIVVETGAAVAGIAPLRSGSTLVVAATHATPVGALRRLLERCGERARAWLAART